MSKNAEKSDDKKMYSIGEVADMFDLHKDTLRNWEKEGKIDPIRVGKRGDRRYTQEHIDKITDGELEKVASQLDNEAPADDQMDLADLKQFLWKSADILRGQINASNYQKYIFALLFYKRMNDVWLEEYEEALEEYKDEDIAKAEHNHRFHIPEDARWETVEQTSQNIGEKLNEVFEKITNANSPKLDKIFDDLDFANKDKFPDETLQKLINHFSKHKFGENYYSSDVLGDAYEYLIKKFAIDAGQQGGEFYTPREIEKVIIQILDPHKKDHIYDPTVGSGGFLLETYQYVRDQYSEADARSLYLYGQEAILSTFAICKINMFLHGLDGADIQLGDTLGDPQFLQDGGSLKQFDIVLANFPYSEKEYSYETLKNNRYGRVDDYPLPPKNRGDYAFIEHIIASLNENGKAGIVVPHGVLFRSGREQKIRKQILEDDLIEGIIGLPENLFHNVSIPAAVMILNKNKPAEHEDKVMVINAEEYYQEMSNQNRLRNEDIDRIVDAWKGYEDIERFARVVEMEEIAENDYNLNIRRYVDTSEPEEQIDVNEAWSELQRVEEDRDEAAKQVGEYITELGYE